MKQASIRLIVWTSSGLACFATTAVGAEPPVHFANEIVPILTKCGCNGGGCHGRADGQNGFKLSLFGYEPQEDHEHIVHEARGRRVAPSAPEQSLLLLKGTNMLPHKGGRRLDPASEDYALIVRWIRQGMQAGTLDPELTGIEVCPAESILGKGASQQLAVTARYSDGTSRDVTHTARYDAADPGRAHIDADGLLTLHDIPGDAAVMIRYQGQVAVFRATVPLGNPSERMAETRNFVDEHVFKKLQTLGLPPSPLCDDGTFLRRVTLDIAGRLPTLEETNAFLGEAAPDKRDYAIERLLESDDYAEFFAGKWSALLRNKRTYPAYERDCVLFWEWIRDSFAANKPYDRFARELLTASGDIPHQPPVAWYRSFKEANVQMEDVAQLFLGTRLQCAQCHHHPYEKWSQRDYLALAAFFSRVAYTPVNPRPTDEENVADYLIVHRRGDAHVLDRKTNEPIWPAALATHPAPLTPDDDPRQWLAEWMTADANPYFARTLVNRYWKHFFGRGIVEPEDDIRQTNPPSNPELLESLARDFVAHDYDVKRLIRTMVQSRAYQLSGDPNAANADDEQNFSRHYPMRLMAEVFFDSVNVVLKTPAKFGHLADDTRAVALPDNSFNASNPFLRVFGRPESASACECERATEASLAQSLYLLNADELQHKLGDSSGRAAELANDTRGDDEKIREIYLLAVSREPTADELDRAQAYLAKKTAGQPAGAELHQASREAWEDLLWAIVNTKEFLFNH